MTGMVCLVPGCPVGIAGRMLMCRDHWRRVPTALRAEVWESWEERRRATRRMRVTGARQEAVEAFQAAVTRHQAAVVRAVEAVG